MSASFDRHVLELDLEAKAEELAGKLRHAVLKTLKRRGLVVAISGGIDSACVAALGVRALGSGRVHGLLLPERDSSPDSLRLGRQLCDRLGISYDIKDITGILQEAGCYAVRDRAVRQVYPDFRPELRWKIVMHGDRLRSNVINMFFLVVQRPDGVEERIRLAPEAYLGIVAATNFKQRTRTMLEYFHADRLLYAVGGTPNRLEYDQGFFVKLGDGAADVKPIAGLYKTQTYAMARHLGVIEEILGRQPTTDTYSLSQSQSDFYFSVDYAELDLMLWAKNHGVPPAEVASTLGFTEEQVGRVYLDIDQKRRATAYLHAPPLLLEDVGDLAPFRIDARTIEYAAIR